MACEECKTLRLTGFKEGQVVCGQTLRQTADNNPASEFASFLRTMADVFDPPKPETERTENGNENSV